MPSLETTSIEKKLETQEPKQKKGLKKELDISIDNWNLIFNSLDLDAGTKQLASHCSFIKID